MRGNSMRKISKKQANVLRTLVALPDETIDLTDLPELREWRRAVVDKFYRPIKRPVTIRLDADALDWLKGEGRGDQTRITQLLRNAMEGSGGRRPGRGRAR